MDSHAERTENVLRLLEGHPEGMNIYDISKALDYHRNSVSRYLDLLHIDGRVDLHYNGREKVYTRSHRVPFNTLRQVYSMGIVGLDKNLDVVDINEPFLKLLNITRKEAVLLQNIQDLSFYPFHDPGIVQSIKAALKGKESSQIIELYDSGKPSYYNLKCIPTIFENKKIGVALLINEELGKKELEEYISLLDKRYWTLSEDQEEYVVRFLPDGTVTFINDAYCRAIGMPREEIIGEKFKPIIPGDDKALLRKYFSSLTPENPAATIEHRSILLDGSIHWQRWKDRAIFEEGEVVEYHSTGFDITAFKQKEVSLIKVHDSLNERLEEKSEEWRMVNQELISEILKREKVESALSESERRYRAIVESQAELIFRWKPDGTLTFVNDAGCRYLGIPRESLLGQNLYGFLLDEDRDRNGDLLGSITPSNPYAIIRHRIVMPTGRIKWQEWSVGAIFDDHGNLIEYQSVGRDINDLVYAKKSQEEPGRCKAIIDKAVDDTPIWYKDAIISLNTDGLFMYISPAVEHMTGFSAEDLLGKHISTFLHPEDYAKAMSSWIKILGGKTDISEFRVFDKWHNIQCMRAFSYPTIKDGKIVGVTSIYGEVNDWKAIAGTLKKSFSVASATLEALPYGIIALDSMRKLAYHNQKFVQMWPIPDSIIGTYNNDTIFDYALDQLANRDELLSKVVEKSALGIDGKLVLKFKDGRTVECAYYPSASANETSYIVLTFNDIFVKDHAENK